MYQEACTCVCMWCMYMWLHSYIMWVHYLQLYMHMCTCIQRPEINVMCFPPSLFTFCISFFVINSESFSSFLDTILGHFMLERCISGQECVMQRTRVQFPEPHQVIHTCHNFSSMQYPPLVSLSTCAHVHTSHG